MATAIPIRIADPMRKAGRLVVTKIDMVKLVFLFLFGAVLAYASATSALTTVTRSKNFAVALALDNSDATALAVKADNLYLASQNRASLNAVRRLARASLKSQALNPRALRLLAYAEDGLLGGPKSRAFIELAARLSRREMGAQIWLIEKSVAANDAVGALRHYDIALRTNSAIQLPLYTQLTAGIELPVIRQALVPYIRVDTPWMRPFLNHAIGNSANPTLIVEAVDAAGGMPEDEEFRDLETMLLSQLVAKGHYAVAREYYLGLHDAKPGVLTSLAFDPANTSARSGPLAWQPLQGAAVGAGWSGDGGKPALAIFANSGERGVVAQKSLFLEPGRHLISVKYGESRMPHTSSIQWTLSCVAGIDNKVAWQSALLRPSTGQVTKHTVDLDADCPSQIIGITIAGGQDQNGAELTIDAAAVAPGS